MKKVGQHFNKERRNVGLHGLYMKYTEYVKPLVAFYTLQGHLLVTLMAKQTKSLQPDLSKIRFGLLFEIAFLQAKNIFNFWRSLCHLESANFPFRCLGSPSPRGKSSRGSYMDSTTCRKSKAFDALGTVWCQTGSLDDSNAPQMRRASSFCHSM